MVLSLPATLLSFFVLLSQQNVLAQDFTPPASLPASSRSALAAANGFTVPTSAQDLAANWEWHAVSGAICRNGSEAGYYLHRQAFDQRLIIYMEGGGACFNALTCAANPPSVGNQAPGREGIYADREDNPFRGWNSVYVPYCTGDVHTGTRIGVAVGGVLGRQNFVGARNMELISKDLQNQLPDLEGIVLAGASAGGIGASFNYPVVKQRWSDIPVILLDDSGFPLEDAFLRPCLQKTFRELWGMNAMLPQDCSDCRAQDGGGLVEYIRYLEQTYGDIQKGMILSTQDSVLRFFFGFSQNECRPIIPGISGQTFEKAVKSLKQGYLQGSIKTYVVPGSTHTFITSSSFYQVKIGGQIMASWVRDLVEQQAQDRGTP